MGTGQTSSARRSTSFCYLDLLHRAYVSSDILVRLEAQRDTINHVVWSLTPACENVFTPDPKNLKSGQSIPEVCEVANDRHVTIPAHTKDMIVCLNIKQGQCHVHSQVFFQPSLLFLKLGLLIDAIPLTQLRSRSIHLPVHNYTGEDILVPKSTQIGWLISMEFHDFELQIPVIRPSPDSLIPEDPEDGIICAKPSRSIAFFPTLKLNSRLDVIDGQEMTDQTVSVLCAESTATPIPMSPDTVPDLKHFLDLGIAPGLESACFCL